jgi:putative flippase GtrA
MFIGINPEASNLFGYTLVIFISYFLNKKYTFGNQNNHSKELPRFLVSMGIAYILNLVTLMVCNRFFEINVYVSQILAGGIYTMSGYLLSKFWVFKKEFQYVAN